MPSFYGEGLPRILLEAAAAGRSVVTTNHPGCRDSIIPNVTGYLVPIKNSKQLADKLEFLASKNKIRSRMGKMQEYLQKIFQQTLLLKSI